VAEFVALALRCQHQRSPGESVPRLG